MKIRYLTLGADLLGTTEHTSFSEILIPFYNEAKADTFIFRKFTHDTHDSWKVEDISVSQQNIDISLSKAQQSKSIGVIAKQSNKSTNKLVNKFNIVEVDFGHKVSSLNIGGVIQDNIGCSATHLPSELYKRRPCIVIAVDGDRVQVMPLTTSGFSSDPESFELSSTSFKGLHSKYTTKPSRTLPRMIQTVSSYRTYPPMLTSGAFPATCFPYKLCHRDKLAFKENLAIHFGSQLVVDHKILKSETEKLKQEKAALFSTNVELKTTKTSLESRVGELEKLIEQVGNEFDVDGEPEEILRALL